MSVQTTYSTEHAVAYAGMKADAQLCNVVSKLNKTGATIPYGLGVVSDGEDGAALPTNDTVPADFIGVVMYEVNRAQADGDVAGIPQDYDGSVITHGVVWVEVLDTVAKDAPVYLRVGSTGTGKFSGVAGTDGDPDEGQLISGAKFLTGGDAGDLVKISLGIGG